MHSTIKRWGNSLSLRIPFLVARRLDLVEGSEVELQIKDELLMVRSPLARRESLEAILEKVPVFTGPRPPHQGEYFQFGGQIYLAVSKSAFNENFRRVIACPVEMRYPRSEFDVILANEVCAGFVATDEPRIVDVGSGESLKIIGVASPYVWRIALARLLAILE